MITVSHLIKQYDGRAVVNDVSFTVENEHFVAIVGKSGSGKTTMLNLIGAMERPDAGSISLDGDCVEKLSERALAHYRNRTIGFVFQDFHLEPTYSVYQNVTLPLEISGDRKEMRKRAEAVLRLVGMQDFIDKNVVKLSGGERQRVCIARAVIQKPKLLLADEPCGNLDSANSAVIMKLLRQLSEDACTVLLITHNRDDARLTDRMLTMHDGKLIADERVEPC